MFPLILIRIKTLSHCKCHGLCLPGTLTQAIRNFAKSLEGWLTNAMRDFPQQVIQTKVTLGPAPGWEGLRDGLCHRQSRPPPRVLRPMSAARTPPPGSLVDAGTVGRTLPTEAVICCDAFAWTHGMSLCAS